MAVENILPEVRTEFIRSLFEQFMGHNPLCASMKAHHAGVLDHFAIIDLGFGNSSMRQLESIFSALGFQLGGEAYLPDKYNDFAWLYADGSKQITANQAMPQVVIADFRLSEFSYDVQCIIKKYAAYTLAFDEDKFQLLKQNGNVKEIVEFLCAQLNRPWPLPSFEEYQLVLQENELTAWALLFGRRVNHFGISVHLDKRYKELGEFNQTLPSEVELNGPIKGGVECGISQSSTLGEPCVVQLEGGEVQARGAFLEFVWRHPNTKHPRLWSDYFTGFIVNNANKVIESLYV